MDLSNIKISGEKVLYALFALFTASGVWYKIVNQGDNQAMATKALQEEVTKVNERLRLLEDDKIKRDAIEEVQGKYYPVQKVK